VGGFSSRGLLVACIKRGLARHGVKKNQSANFNRWKFSGGLLFAQPTQTWPTFWREKNFEESRRVNVSGLRAWLFYRFNLHHGASKSLGENFGKSRN